MLKWLVRAAAALVACALMCAPALAEEAAGRWKGQLPPPIGLHIVLNITKAADGSYAGELISPDQGPQGIAASKVEATADHLVFTIDKLHVVYEAHWDAAKSAWAGTFSQGGQSWALDLVRDASTAPPAADPLFRSPLLPAVAGLDGQWQGTLELGSVKLRLVLRVVSRDGGAKAGLDSPDQGASGIPVTALSRDGQAVAFAVASAGLSFKGVLAADGQSIAGTFSQGGKDVPLTLTRLAAGAEAAKPRRPQEEAIAAAPLPYRAEDVTFANPAATDVKLAGTLTLPKGPGPFPAVVLIAGSGPHDRDEDVFGHKVFLVLADHLTRQGLAVLRYDKRGIGKSGGDGFLATTADFASDSAAAVAFLRARPDVDPRRVGLIGHSEGGVIAPMVAAKDPSLGFIVLMAGTGVPGRDVISEQTRRIALANGAPQAAADRLYALELKLADAISGAKNSAEAVARTRAVLDAATPKPPQAFVDEATQLAKYDWTRFFLTYDPATALREVRVPVLVLNGSRDLQVIATQNLPPIRAALANDRDVTIIEMPGLNHLFQHATTGSPAEYGGIEETLAPEFLQTVSDWIGKHVK
jgi:dienelactone hydrolase